MKKILSLALAGVMMFSTLPVAYAADVDYKTGTNVTVVGDGGEYYVTVPATLKPGQTGTVKAYGKWASNQTVKVWTDDTVEVTHVDTGAKTDVNIDFDGIESLGNDVKDMEVTAPISIDKGNIRFGEWTGIIEYNVELSGPFTFKVHGATTTADIGMTWEEWVNSEYNTVGYTIEDNQVKHPNAGALGGTVYIWNQTESKYVTANEEIIATNTYNHTEKSS